MENIRDVKVKTCGKFKTIGIIRDVLKFKCVENTVTLKLKRVENTRGIKIETYKNHT